jgi:hypothetical protein
MSRILVEDGDLYLGEHVESGFLVIVGHCMLLLSSLLVFRVMSMSWGKKECHQLLMEKLCFTQDQLSSN